MGELRHKEVSNLPKVFRPTGVRVGLDSSCVNVRTPAFSCYSAGEQAGEQSQQCHRGEGESEGTQWARGRGEGEAREGGGQGGLPGGRDV